MENYEQIKDVSDIWVPEQKSGEKAIGNLF
jgi:hypothetical protein